MPRNTRFNIAKNDIVNYFNNNGRNIYSFDVMVEILNENRDIWRLAKRLTTKAFIELLLANTKLKSTQLVFPHYNFTRYSWGEPNLIVLLNGLMNNSYFSHYTALFLHGLTEQIPKNYFINVEQSEKRNNSKPTLEQTRIEWAFKRKQRETNNIAIYRDNKIYILNGKFTNKLGVIDFKINGVDNVNITSIERTLIDIIVRPNYAGGIFETLKAYTNAAGKISINKMAAYISKLNYTYPYHQSIGFLLEKTGKYTLNQINILKQFEMKYDFYLTYGMKEMEYSKEWKLFYPKGI